MAKKKRPAPTPKSDASIAAQTAPVAKVGWLAAVGAVALTVMNGTGIPLVERLTSPRTPDHSEQVKKKDDPPSGSVPKQKYRVTYWTGTGTTQIEIDDYEGTIRDLAIWTDRDSVPYSSPFFDSNVQEAIARAREAFLSRGDNNLIMLEHRPAAKDAVPLTYALNKDAICQWLGDRIDENPADVLKGVSKISIEQIVPQPKP